MACSNPPRCVSYWTKQAIADELISLELVNYSMDSIICREWYCPKANAYFRKK